MKRIFLIGAAMALCLTPLSMNLAGTIRPWANNPSGGKAGSPQGMEGKKTGGIVGDPSQKRGFDLGYDAGPRAGREDRADLKNPDPFARQEFQKPDQFYRYEYGSRVLFKVGFRRGFLRGYNEVFGKAGLSRKPRLEGATPREPLPRKVTFAEDAL